MAIMLRLPEDLENKIRALAKKNRKPKVFYVAEAVKTYLEDLEDCYLAEQRLNDVENGVSELVSLEQVEEEQWFGK